MTAEAIYLRPTSRACCYIGRVGALAVALGVGMAIATGQGIGIANAEDANPSPDTAEKAEGPEADPPSTDPAPPAGETPTADVNRDFKPQHVADRLAPRMRLNVSGGARILDRLAGKDPKPDDSEDQDTVKAPRGLSRRIDRQAAPVIKVDLPGAAAVTTRVVPRAPRPVRQLRGAVNVGPTTDLKPTATRQPTTPTALRVSAASVPAAAVRPVRAVSTTFIRVANDVLSAAVSPLATPRPRTPQAPQPALLAVLGWIRREVQTAFFNRTPQIPAQKSISLHLSKPTDVATIDLKALSNDPDRDRLTYTVSATTGNGKVTIDNATGVLTYDPADNMVPNDESETFVVTVSDANSPAHLHGLFGFLRPDAGHSATSTITVTLVNKAPVGTADSIDIDEDTTIGVSADSNYNPLDNDTDAENDTLTAVLIKDTTHGKLKLNTDGSYTYTPDADFNGQDSFTYRAADGFTESADTTLTINVKPVNDKPVVETARFDVDAGAVVTGDFLNYVTDIDGDHLTLISARADHGTLDIPEGSTTFVFHTLPDVAGTAAINYVISDGTVEVKGQVQITTRKVTHAPVANDDELTTRPGIAIAFEDKKLLTNDTDADGDTTTIVASSVTPAQNGSLRFDGQYFFYTPKDGFHGVDTFTYRTTDGTDDSNLATVKIYVNTPPTAVNDPVTTRHGVEVSGALLVNDSDPDGDELAPRLKEGAGPKFGVVALTDKGVFTYKPNPTFAGTDEFSYTISDAYKGTAEAKVVITVTNTAPIAKPDSDHVTQGQTLTVNGPGLLGNDSDPDNDNIFVKSVAQSINAEPVTFTAEGGFTYKPKPGFAGVDTFTYTISDGVTSSEGQITITVNAPADLPPRGGEIQV